MFDLFRSRQKAVRYMLGAMLMLVALSMVITLIPGYGSSSARSAADDQTIADIGNQKLTAVDVQRAAQRNLRQIPPEMMQTYVPQIIDSMIQQRALVFEFERLGLTVTDDEVLNAVMGQLPQFFPNGQLTSKEQLELALGQQGLTFQDLMDATRSDLILARVQNIEYESTVVSPKEVNDELVRKYERAKIKYIAFPVAKYRDQVKPDDADLQAFFNARRNQFITPEKRSFQVLVVEQDKVEASLQVSDAQLRAAYAASMDNFRIPERVHARHILIKTVDKSDAEKKQLLAKAQDVLKQVKGGADFAEVAKKNSDDTGTAPKGGDLDWVVRGQIAMPEFEKAVFTLKPKDVSDVITTSIGYDIVQVIEKEPARVKPFDEVKGALAAELRQQGLTDKMQAIADQARAALAKSPGSAAEVAKQFNLEVVTVPKGGPNEAIPTLGVSPEIESALGSMKKNDVSPVLALPANRLAVVILNDRTPARQSELNEVEGQVREKVLSDKAQALASQRAKEVAEKLRAGEDMDKLAKSMKLDVTESTEFGHTDSVEGLGPAASVNDAFTKPVGTILGPISITGRDVVYQIVDQKRMDPNTLAQERAAILEQLKRRKGGQEFALFMDSVLNKLIAEGKVVIHPDARKRLIASYR